MKHDITAHTHNIPNNNFYTNILSGWSFLIFHQQFCTMFKLLMNDRYIFPYLKNGECSDKKLNDCFLYSSK